ncbi:YVTN repeat-like/Quino protein amine dehydrogenase [Massarina eburnea CBS 473.64]|uniref:YVTN repeat-like/Quino protein amine dehydrogenase n=1 Tax=Massarina eburnea CBS 473.64 TaxID=1395130 RepID=A0A6A6RGU5_9PLEO|nr:YVTN repeat-like/Quino protein amine dehydrogenase [Massarina eburnea CBS 473.64]
MNTRPVLDPNAGPYALSASFNADNSCFSVALESGFRIISSSNGETKHTREVGGGIGCAELLGTTKYVALVGGGKQPKFPQNKVRPEDSDWVHVSTDTYEVQIFDDANEKVTTALEFKTPVQRVRMTKTHLVVVLLNTIGIYRMKIPPEKLVPDYETVNNPFGLCALGEGVLVFPGRTPGQLKFFNLATKQVSITTAHNAPLRALGVSQKGDMVATASEKGTLIRVWSYPSCTKLAELRRGVDDAAIFSLAFSPNGALLAVTSDKSTLHLFDIASASQPKPDPSKHKWGSLSLAGPLLPRQFSDTYSFTSAKFEIGDEPLGWGPQTNSATFNAAIPGVPGGRPTKGLVGWLDNQTLIVVGAGQDARWEKFAIGVDQMGKRVVYREGWRRYLDV